MADGNQYTIKQAIEALMKQKGVEEEFNQAKVISAWKKLMGAPIAQYTDKIYIKEKTLFIHITSAPLKQELSYTKDKIIRMMNEEAGTEVIDEVVIR